MNRLASALAALAAAFALGAPSDHAHAASQLFKCVDGGRTVYQQQACPVSAQAEPAPSASRPVGKAKADGAVTAASAVTAAKLKPASPPASGAPATRR
jgi:hypothetical protein